MNDLPHISVATATLFVVDTKDHHRVLLTQTRKHRHLILPGGKIELQDCSSDDVLESAMQAAVRELQEELGCTAETLTYFKTIAALATEPREMPVSTFRDTLAAKHLEHFSDEQLVLAHYGSPDYLFIARVEAALLQTTDEVEAFEFIDIRSYDSEKVDAAHRAYLALYREFLDT